MNLLLVSKSVCLLAIAVFLGFGSYLLWTVSQTTKQVGQQASSLIAHADSSVTQIDSGFQTTFDNLNRLCGTDKPCGTLENFNRTLNTVNLAAGQIVAISQFEKPQLAAINSQELQLFSDTSKVLNGLSETVTTTNSAIVNIVPVENEIDTEVVALQKSTRDFDTLLLDPDIPGTLRGMSVTSNNFAATSTDFQNKFHDVLYPPPCKGKLCFAIKAWPYVKAASEMAEPAYWGDQLFESIKH